jgi:hypothetical protein
VRLEPGAGDEPTDGAAELGGGEGLEAVGVVSGDPGGEAGGEVAGGGQLSNHGFNVEVEFTDVNCEDETCAKRAVGEKVYYSKID